MNQPLKILILEDSPADAEVVQRLLSKEKSPCEFSLATNETTYLLALDDFKPDLILSDHSLPQFDSTSALAFARQKFPSIPFIMVTGAVSEEFAAEIIRMGADDYILKDRLNRLPAAIESVLKQRQAEKEKREAELRIMQSENNLRAIFENTSESFLLVDHDGHIKAFNRKMEEHIYRATKKQPAIGSIVHEFVEDARKETFKSILARALAGETEGYEVLYNLEHGEQKWVVFSVTPVKNGDIITGACITGRDITERKIAEQQLQTAYERLSFHVENAPLGFIEWDHELNVKSWSKHAEEIFGWTEKECITMQKNGYSLVYEDDLEAVRRISEQLIYGKTKQKSIINRNYTRDGRIIWCEWFNSVLTDKNGRVITILSLVQDVTERKKSEEYLLKSEMRLKEAQSITHISNWEIDLAHNTHAWSDELFNILGISRKDFSPSANLFLSFVHPADLQPARRIIKETFEQFTESKIDFRFIHKNGQKRYGHMEWRFEFDETGKPFRLFGILQDITERKEAEKAVKRLEKKIQDQKVSEQKKIARAVITGQEKERNYIAQELHDNINQILAGTKMFLSVAAKKNAEIMEAVKYPMELIDSSIQEIRVLSKKLVIPQRGIELNKLVEDILDVLAANTGVKVKLDYSLADTIIGDDLKLNIYRIVQEQVNNIQKYAEAKKVDITMVPKKGFISLTITDDGKGFDTRVQRKGIGISNIIYRAECFGGKVSVKSSPGNGCRISVNIPF